MSYRLNDEDMATLKRGTMIEAIRVVRYATDWPLRQCKQTVEGLRAGLLRMEDLFEPKSPCTHCKGTGFEPQIGGDASGTPVPLF